MTPAQKRPEAPRGSTSSQHGFDFETAALLWGVGRDTQYISQSLSCFEAEVYNRLDKIKDWLRLAPPKALKQTVQHFAHRAQFVLPASGQTPPLEATLARGADSSPPLAPFSQIHHPTHSASSEITVAVSQTNSDTRGGHSDGKGSHE